MNFSLAKLRSNGLKLFDTETYEYQPCCFLNLGSAVAVTGNVVLRHKTERQVSYAHDDGQNTRQLVLL